jgi:hypothetical protein
MSKADIEIVDKRLKEVRTELRAKYKYPKVRAKIQQRIERLKRWKIELECLQ